MSKPHLDWDTIMPEIMRMKANGAKWNQISRHFDVGEAALRAHVAEYSSRLGMRLDALAQELDDMEEIARATAKAVNMVVACVTQHGGGIHV